MTRQLEQLRHDVFTLATAEGRMVGTAGHASAREYLVERLGKLDLFPYSNTSFTLPYRAEGTNLCNVIGTIPGHRAELAPILIGAHYDTCGPLPGADDNAAAVAIALCVAERLLSRRRERSVIVAFFDGEEPPHYLSPAMGSRHFYEHQRTGPVHCAIVMDLVGHDLPVAGLEDLVFVTGMESDPGLAEVAGNMSSGSVRIQPVLNRYVGDLSDHQVFRENQRPYLFLSCGRWQHYHSATDTPEKLNYDKMLGIADYLTELVVQTSAADLPGPFDTGDTLKLETDAVRAHFGGLIGPAARLSKRWQMDAFVALAMAMYGL